ncbi:MAG: glycosyltransferase 87 family protein, partial [bacterium]
GHINLYLGQLGLTTALGTLLALSAAKRRPVIAGLGLALVSIKPNFAIPLALLMLCRRDYRAVLIGVAVGGLGALVATAVLAARFGSLETFLAGMMSYVSLETPPAIPQILLADGRIDVIALATRFLGGPPSGLAKMLIFGGWLAVGAAGVAALRRTEDSRRADGLTGFLIVLATLTCIYHQIYDAVLLIVPILAVTAACREPWKSLSPMLRSLVVPASA